MTDHNVATREEWIQARKALLAEEKEFTRARDALSAKRRALPWRAMRGRTPAACLPQSCASRRATQSVK